VGDLEVTASTTGQDQDSDGYTVTVDGTQSQSVASNGTITFSGLAAATHSVELTGVASNCSVSGTNPRDVDVPNGGTASVTFDVSCSQQVGDLDVSASTTGQDQDTDGYTVTVDPGTASESSQALGVNATVTFADLPDGDHQVELTGLRSNCSVVTDPNPRTVTVPGGGSASTTFEVDCVARTGSIDVSTTTTGGDPDPDGYTVEVDGGPVGPIGLNDNQTFSGIDEGTRTVSLSGVSSHCAVATNDQSVSVDFNATTSVSFDVSCPSPLSNQIVFESDRDDPGGNTSIFVMNPDGSGLQRLTDPSFDDSNPHVSPDGRRIVFVSGRGGSGPELWIMNPDGSGMHRLLDITFTGFNPQWSPVVPPNADTTQIAFARGGGDRDLWVVDADGTDRRQLTNTADCEDLPTWSPDGARIAFTSTSGSCNDAGSDVWVTLADGSGTPTQVTTASGFDGNPTWAEQAGGTNFIAFSSGRDGDEEVYRVTVDADGTNPTNVTNLTQSSASNEGFAAWKPDGTAIVFYSDRDGQAEVYTMSADGSAQTRLTTDPRTDWAPVWTP
jgi:Tol biopolymer transport system component